MIIMILTSYMKRGIKMFSRLISLIGIDNFKLIQQKKVLVFGLGGVGGYVCEMLCRSGITNLGICDFDTIAISNKNRQIIALDSTIGKLKTEVMKDRLKDINKDILVETYNFKVDENTINKIKTNYDYIIDCIDDINGKLAIIKYSYANNIKIISSMGTGNKLDPNMFKIKKINQTKVCPLAKIMRHRIKELNITDLPVLYSEEEPLVKNAKEIPSSIFTPAAAGILLARWVILDIINIADF